MAVIVGDKLSREWDWWAEFIPTSPKIPRAILTLSKHPKRTTSRGVTQAESNMGAPSSGIKATDQPAAESLLTAFKNLSAAERRRHASVLNYWLSVRGDKEFPPLHDLDPLELSDAGPNSVLLELISGGHDAEVRHLGEALREEAWPERIIDAPNPSVLACIAKKLPIVAISRDFLAFEDEYDGPGGKIRCSATLLPLSAGGAWVDYVYALVSVDGAPAKAAKAEPKKTKAPEPEPKVVEEQPEAVEAQEPTAEEEPAVEEVKESVAEIEEPVAEGEAYIGEVEEPVAEIEDGPDPEEPVAAAVAKAAPGFSKLLDSIAGLTGFYGSQPVKVEPVIDEEPAEETVPQKPVAEEPVADEPPVEETIAEEPVVEEPVVEEPAVEEPPAEEPIAEVAEPVAEEPEEKPTAKQPKQPAPVAPEGTLQNKLTEVRAKADEARMARLRANAALYEGLAAAYDFALDAEDAPEEYLRLVEAQGLKIQLRSPMKPVVKLAFAGMCDDATIKQLEAILAWAFDEELPRGALADRIEAAGGIGPILTGQAKAA
jgi:hypothetical protein